MEHSYASGRSDLEMEGKFHTPFAKDHYLMEFKYISNATFDSRKLDIGRFEADTKDLEQLARYDRALRSQYPEKQIHSYLIYCFGNRGFRIFKHI